MKYKLMFTNISGSDLLVSSEHRVYSSQNSLSNSFGDKTFIGDNSLNILSPEKIGQFNLSASAKYCTSFKCLESDFSACGKNSENSDLGINVICSNINFRVLSNTSFDNPDILNILSLCFSNSVNKNSGATNSNLLNKELEANTSKGLPPFNKDERTTLTSTTNFILDYSKYLFDNASFILSENSSTSCSVNLDFDKPLFNLSISSSLNLINLLNNIDQSMLGICLINSSSSGISNRISVINPGKKIDYLNLSDYRKEVSFEKITAIKQHFSQTNYIAVVNTSMKNYVDFQNTSQTNYINTKLNLSGGSMTGNLNLSANINLTMNGGNQIGSNVTCVTIKGPTSVLEVC